MKYGYPTYDETDEKKTIEELDSIFNSGITKPLIDIEALCHCLNLPYDEIVFMVLENHIYTPDIDNDFFHGFSDNEDSICIQMTDYEGFQKLIRYAQTREEHLDELKQCFSKALKGEN